ncbi:MAG: 2-hydroxychromene-2-carboxylate isomerase [Alphaproteobacteria bacterium]
MSVPKVEFHFDFGSPNAYCAHRLIPGIEQRTGVTFTYFPILLGGVFKATNNRSPMEQFGEVKNKPEYQRREMERFMTKHKLDRFRRNPHFPVITVQLMRGALVAEDEGYLTKYVEAAFFHMWEEPKKMDDPEVIRTAFDESGLDGAHILTRIGEQPIKDKLIANTNRSVERGNFGSPTVFVGDEMFFGKDRLRDVEEWIVEQMPGA